METRLSMALTVSSTFIPPVSCSLTADDALRHCECARRLLLPNAFDAPDCSEDEVFGSDLTKDKFLSSDELNSLGGLCADSRVFMRCEPLNPLPG